MKKVGEILDKLLAIGMPLFRFLYKALPFLAIALLLAVLAAITLAATQATPLLIDTKGVIGNSQRDTLFLATLIMLIIVLPVFFLAIFIAIRYREGNKKARYSPKWNNSKRLEIVWWGVPVFIVMILSLLTWKTTRDLDPYRPLASTKQAVQVQVVALQWKWLFIYPEYNIASVNELAMPVDRPVEFTITSDAPMNSFWIPQLGGQIYAMTGMSTKLHLEADEVGDYRGMSANISGKGHAEMTFTAKARSEKDYMSWLSEASRSQSVLDKDSYESLRQPSLKNKVTYYHLPDATLYDQVIARYSGGHNMEGTQH